MEARAGKYVVNLSGEAQYKSFSPSPLPPQPPLHVDDEFVNLLARANHKIGVLEGKSVQIPDIGLFMAMYVRKEALMSSQIEGTQATLEDVLDTAIDQNVNRDVKEVINYVKATEAAIELLKSLPLCCRLLRKVHEVLMSGTRGEEKNPGEFRRSQNWIGSAGSTIRTARYIPPNPEDMANAMSDLEKYINDEDETDILVKAALIHYQFETIHPFLDGNGRIGRLLIILFLMDRKILTTPALYISYFLKKNRIEYYDRMTEVRRKGDYEQWVKFFLRAVIESSDNAIHTIEELSELHNRNLLIVNNMGRAKVSALRLFSYIEASPIIGITRTASDLCMSFNTVSSSIKRLCAAGILLQGNNSVRKKVFYYKEYLDILRQGTE